MESQQNYDRNLYDIYTYPYYQLTVKEVDDDYIVSYFMTFDIETTSINEGDNHSAFMYCWQATLNGITVFGRTWTELGKFFEFIKSHIEDSILVVYCHNLSFEFQFLRTMFHVNSVFATEPRKILKARIEDSFEFRCSYRLTNMSLARFLKASRTVPEDLKKGENFDYKKIRTPSTELSQTELNYCRNDVLGLYIAITELLNSENDTLTTIPLTSTGYVRREARKAMFTHPTNRQVIRQLTLTPLSYNLCKNAIRGGNCHCNPFYSNIIVKNVKSKDMSSAYPAVMMQCKYPMRQFLATDDEITNLNPNKAYLMELELYDVSIKYMNTIPYISYAKSIHTLEATKDNGRILEAKYIHLVVTDIDWKIIKSQYNIESIDVVSLYSADYGYLPDDYRQYIYDRYIRKCELKFGDPYYYNKEKNKINSLFGMMLTDIIHPIIEYHPHNSKPYVTQEVDLTTSLARLKASKTNFLAFQWGVWVTAHCRYRLQRAIDLAREKNIDPVYCDTDSLKCHVPDSKITDFNELFALLNNEILEETAKCGFNTTYETHGKTFNLGLWEDDGEYAQFKSLGAKKYYCINVDGRQSITVAGLSKSLGLDYLVNKKEGIKSFRPGTIIPAEFSGRTASHYIDLDEPHIIKVNGDTFRTGSAIAIENVSYTFSLTEDYAALLTSINTLKDKPII